MCFLLSFSLHFRIKNVYRHWYLDIMQKVSRTKLFSKNGSFSLNVRGGLKLLIGSVPTQPDNEAGSLYRVRRDFFVVMQSVEFEVDPSGFERSSKRSGIKDDKFLQSLAFKTSLNAIRGI